MDESLHLKVRRNRSSRSVARLEMVQRGMWWCDVTWRGGHYVVWGYGRGVAWCEMWGAGLSWWAIFDVAWQGILKSSEAWSVEPRGVVWVESK